MNIGIGSMKVNHEVRCGNRLRNPARQNALSSLLMLTQMIIDNKFL